MDTRGEIARERRGENEGRESRCILCAYVDFVSLVKLWLFRFPPMVN